MPLCNPIIVVPGINANYLKDEYPIPPEIVWAVMGKDYERVGLHPDNPNYEAVQPARTVPDQLHEIVYKELIEELRDNLSRPDDPVPVYPFAYDWRQRLDVIEHSLADFIEEVIDRTALMRNYHPIDPANRKVNLIGHSMGGVIIAGYLQAHGSRGQVNKVATLAAPFKGSFESVIKITTGTANLGVDSPSSRERRAARVTPSLYHLLPNAEVGLEVDPIQRPGSLFDAGIWQPSILETLEDYIRRHAVDRPTKKGDLRQRSKTLFAGMLDTARKHRDRIEHFDVGQGGLAKHDWLCVVGVDAVTRVRLRVVNADAKPGFVFSTRDRDNRWGSGTSDVDRRLTGDGTVPFNGAVPAFLPYESLVCVSPDDYGDWEILDRSTSSFAGFHGLLPNMNLLHRLIVRHFTGAPDRHGNTWGRPAPGVTGFDWIPPLAGLRDRQGRARPK